MDAENPALGLDVGQRELNLAVDPTGPNKRGIERFDLVRRHYHLLSVINHLGGIGTKAT